MDYRRTLTRAVLVLTVGLCLGLLGSAGGLICSTATAAPPESAAHPSPLPVSPAADEGGKHEGQVFLATGMPADMLIPLAATIAASGQPGVLLIDTPKSSPHTKQFLAAFKPEHIIPVGSVPQGIADLEERLGVKMAPLCEWQRGPPTALWKAFFPRAEQVVVCPAQPRGLLLQSACLAGVLQAPLFVVDGKVEEAAELRSWLKSWGTRQVLAAGDAGRALAVAAVTPGGLDHVRISELADQQAVAQLHLRQLLKKGAVTSLVIANPADNEEKLGDMSVLASLVALRRQAALLLTDKSGDECYRRDPHCPGKS